MSFQVMLEQLAGGFVKSLGIFTWTLILSMLLGLVVCAGRMCRSKIISRIIIIYISIMRGTPLMLQLLVWYYGPFYLWGADIKGYRYPALILGFVFNYAAYFAEIYRSGFQSVDVGQHEAARMLGYSKMQTLRKIILPQVIKAVLPSITNEVITLVKDTSMAFVLTYAEMFTLTKQIAAAQTSMMPFVIAAVFYYIFNYVVSEVMNWFEKKMSYYN